MGATQQVHAKWESLDLLYVGIDLKIEATVPTTEPLLFDYTQRRSLGCKHIIAVKHGGTKKVVIHAADCTPYEAVEEYRKIVNKQNGYDDSDSPEGQDSV